MDRIFELLDEDGSGAVEWPEFVRAGAAESPEATTPAVSTSGSLDELGLDASVDIWPRTGLVD